MFLQMLNNQFPTSFQDNNGESTFLYNHQILSPLLYALIVMFFALFHNTFDIVLLFCRHILSEPVHRERLGNFIKQLVNPGNYNFFQSIC